MPKSEPLALESLEDTRKLAVSIKHELGDKLATAGHNIGLSGPLGAGKTTLVRYLVEEFGGSNVSSPSFVLQHCYKTSSGIEIEHWDLYRLKAAPEELFEPPAKGVLRLIEWCERDPNLRKELDQTITYQMSDSNRFVTVIDLR